MTDDTQPLLPPHEQSTLYKIGRLRRKRWMKPLAPVLFFLVTALFAHFAAFHNVIELGIWFTDWAPILISVALLGIFTLFFYSLTGRFRAACAMTFVLTVTVSLAHWMKLAVGRGPLYPWDLALVGETANVMDWSCLLGYWPNLLLMLLAVPALVITWLLLPRAGRADIPIRLGGLSLCIAFFVSLFFPQYSALRPFHDRILQRTFQQNQTYARAGVLLGFAAYVQYFNVQPPPDYSERTIDERDSRYAPTSMPAGSRPAAATAPANTPKPINLILVLSESFWDPTALAGVTFGDKDPIPTFRRLARDFGRVDMVCPVFGGGTCDSELEVLTGCNMAFFPPGSAPYKYYIRKPTPSLASILRDQGYNTIAVHAVEDSYFNDREVQPRLGFDTFLNATKWKHVEKVQYYITDASTSREVIRIADAAAKEDKPFFISVNSMEVHWPYPADRYYNRIDMANLQAPDLDPKLRETLETYIAGLRRADKALKMLVDHFSKSDEPTMIVFYGDHLPALGEDYILYRKTGIWNDDDSRLPLHTVPAVFWSNCGITLAPRDRRPISTCYLSPIILRTMSRPLPPFFRFLEACKKQYPIFSVSGCVDANGKEIPIDDVLQTDLANDYRLFQYDRVFGNQYFRKYTLRPAP